MEHTSGYCACGCGERTPISRYTDARYGARKGSPLRFIRGHAIRVDIKTSFWQHVDKSGDCWLWLASVDRRDAWGAYGQIRRQGKTLKSHRVAYELSFGPIPDGMHVLHACDNPLCCRPEHLILGTHQDNMADMKAKGRWRNQTSNQAPR